jgi:hypothetical protein
MASIVNIDDILGKVSTRGGLALMNRYRVEFDRESEIMQLLCHRAQLPGRQILTVERRVDTSFQKIAYGYAVDDINLSFRLTNDYVARKYFDKWQKSIYELSQDVHRPKYKKGLDGLGFNSGYAREVKIYQLDKNGEDTYGVLLEDAYPTSLSATDLSSEADNTISEINVQLSYKRWSEIKLNAT